MQSQTTMLMASRKQIRWRNTWIFWTQNSQQTLKFSALHLPLVDKSLRHELKLQRQESNKSELELKEYLSNLHNYCENSVNVQPKNPNGEQQFVPLYDYRNTINTKIDQRSAFTKLMNTIEEKDEQLFETLADNVSLSSAIDLSYLDLWSNTDSNQLQHDTEYPDWVWKLVPESTMYWWSDLVQTPFENLSDKEKEALLNKWQNTYLLANRMWAQSELGKYGRSRHGYNDLWPEPLTKMDIPAYNTNDRKKYLKQRTPKDEKPFQINTNRKQQIIDDKDPNLQPYLDTNKEDFQNFMPVTPDWSVNEGLEPTKEFEAIRTMIPSHKRQQPMPDPQ